MSTAKRSRRQQTGAGQTSPLPASKRLKTTTAPHVPQESGLGFLVDENARAGKKLSAQLTNGVPRSKATRVDESRAQVAPDAAEEDAENVNGKPGDDIISISSRESESELEESEDEEEAVGDGQSGAHDKALTNGHALGEEDAGIGAEDDRMEGIEGDAVAATDRNGATDEDAEPSFGDMMQSRHPEPIDIQASFPGPKADQSALVSTEGKRALAVPSATSLATVITQALKTNDKDQLEACIQITDLPSIRSSIQRLQSQHAATLLQRLSERIHKRPGRTGNLMIWVQWILVTHGGYLSTQPDVMKRLKSLTQVVRARASSLQPLLHLKGKLDLLSSQLELRRNMQAASKAAHATDDDDEEAVLYIEGQDEDWSEDDDVIDAANVAVRSANKPLAIKSKHATDVDAAEDDESEDDMPNGVMQEIEEDSDEEDEDEAGMLDDEAEETSDDEGDEDSSDQGEESAADSDEDTDPSEDESEPEIKQPQPKTLNRKR